MKFSKNFYLWISYIIRIAAGSPLIGIIYDLCQVWTTLLYLIFFLNLAMACYDCFFHTPFCCCFFSLRLHTSFVTSTLIFELKKYLQIGNGCSPQTFFLFFISSHETTSSHSKQMAHISTVTTLPPFLPALGL